MEMHPEADENVERYAIVFDVKADPENHVSTRPEDNGAKFRRFVVQLGSPLDKRLFIRTAFAGPSDTNFLNLVAELRSGLTRMEEESKKAPNDVNGNDNDTKDKTETS